MRRAQANSVLERRLKGLAGAYANIFRAESFDDDYLDPDYMRSSRHAFEMLAGAFRRNYIDEIGEKAALRVLRATSRTYILHKYFLRIGLLVCFPVLLHVHGVSTATLLQTLLYLSARPLAWLNRGRGARVAERVLQYRIDSPRGTPAVRRALRAEISSIPAQALYSWRWKEHLEELLPVEEDVREIALKLANQYEGSLRELTETSWALAR
jgi:hypothetical protein